MRLPRLLIATLSAVALATLAAPPASAAAPDAPASVTATGGNGSIVATWTAPASDGGSIIRGYTAQAFTSAGGSTASSECRTSDATTLTCTIPDLAPATTYYVTVVARNDDGTGPEAPRVTATTTSLPGSPRSVTLTRVIGGVSVSWTAPASASTAPISEYTATAYPSSSSSTALGSCTTSGLSCSITGLESSATVSVSVTATNGSGTSAPSSRVSISPGSVPGAPTNVKAPRGNGFSRVTWSAPASTGGSSITGYTARAWSAAEGGTLIATCTPATATGLTCDLGPLPNGSTYYVDVVATTSLGTSVASSPRVSVITATTPTVPRSVTAIRVGPDIAVRWAVPESDGGLPITSYVATAFSALTGGTAVGTCTTDGETCAIRGLTGKPVYVSVIARTAAGDSPASTPRIQVRLIAPSATVTAVAGSARPEGIAVSWKAPMTSGGKPILFYTARAFNAPTGGTLISSCELRVNGANAKATLAGSTLRTGCTIPGLEPQSISYVDVSATTEYGTATTPQRTAIRVRQAPPLAPQDVRGFPAYRQILVTWQIPSSDGGSPIIDYRAQAWTQEKGGQLVDECVAKSSRDASRLSCTVSVPRNYEPYWVEVTARNASGTSKPSARIALEAREDEPPAPEHVEVEPIATGLQIDWDTPPADGGYPIYRYVATAYDAPTGGNAVGSCTVDVAPLTSETRSTPSQCVITGLPAEQFVYVEVTAENTVGVSAPSARVASAASFVP